MIFNVNMASDAHHRLMNAIGATIRAQNTISPMTGDDVIGVLGAMIGVAIARGAKKGDARREMREMAIANIDQGLQATVNMAARNAA